MASAPDPAVMIIRLPPELKQAIQAEAVERSTSMNTVVVEGLASLVGLDVLTPRYTWPSSARKRSQQTKARKATRTANAA